MIQRIRKDIGVYCSALALLAVASCSKQQGLKTEPPVQIPPADSLSAYPGMNGMMLTWQVSDPGIKQAVAYCDNGDSIVVPYAGGAEMTATFRHLPEGNYSFSIVVTDAQGHRSARAKLVAHVYGSQYEASLVSRKVSDAIFDKGQVDIAWLPAPPTAIGTQIAWVDTAGDSMQMVIKPGDDSAHLAAYKPGTYFRYRSLFKPVPGAVDTFYAAYASSETFSTFSNPLFDDKGADPWVVYKDGTYYFTYTTGGAIVLYATKKMSALGAASPVTIWTPPPGTSHSREVWAPEMHFLDGSWYVYFAADDGQDIHHRMFVLENSSPDPLEGTWTFKGELQEPSDQWAIDGTVLSLGGKLYFIWSGKTDGAFPQDIYIAGMTNPYTLEGSRIRLSSPVYSWEKNGAPINEGPEILKNKAGGVFLVYSASGYWTDDYCLGMLSLKAGGDPLNPADWVKSPQPVFQKDAGAGAFGPGHCSFFASRDGTQDWIIYHARSFANGGSTNHRNPRIQPFAWNADGTPDFGKPVGIHTEIQAPSGEF